jgi:flagellar biosynthesis chaperone FliJ
MSARDWLPTMIKARKAAENAAAIAVAQARRELEQAADNAQQRRARLDSLTPPASCGIGAFMAAAAIGDAAAASHAAAVHRVDFATTRLQSSVGELTLAAQRHESVQKFGERLDAEAATARLAHAQRELDDITVSRFRHPDVEVRS